MKKWIWILVSASLIFGQQKMIKQIEISDQDGQEKKVEVKVQIDDGNALVEVTRDGKTETLEFPLEEKDNAAIQKKLAELGVNLDDLDLEEDSEYSMNDFMKQFSFLSGPKSFLGVQLQDLTDQLRTYFKLDSDGGVLISEVVKDSPAEKAKLKAGDIILKVDDTRISNAEELRDLVGALEPGTTIRITYFRSGKEKTTKAELEKRNEDQLSWFGKGWRHMPPFPEMKHHNFMFFDDDDNRSLTEDHFREEMEAMKKELESLRKELEEIRNQ
jgi:C-terminal processing protease CtpA/Prc